MKRCPSEAVRKWLAICLGGLASVLALPSTSKSAPVTVTVQFQQPAVEAFGGSGGGNLAVSTVSAAGVTGFTIFNQVVLPRIESKSEQQARQEELAQRLPQRPRTFGGTVRYEHVDFEGEASGLDGDIYATNLHMAWDVENFTLGILVPYEFLDLRSFDANLIGTILYAQYNLHLNPIFTLELTANSNYTFTAINNDFRDVNTFGGGLGLSLTMDRSLYVISGAFTYQINKDDSESDNDHQHLVKIGANAGYRVGESGVINLFGTLNQDITSYTNTLNVTDNTYWDVGIAASWSLTSTWNLNGGYKRILGLKDFESNQFFVGTLLRF